MEAKVVETSKNKLVIQVQGADHTICNILQNELLSDSKVKSGGYVVDHPLLGNPRVFVETDGNEDPKKALIEAAKRLQKKCEKFGAALGKK